MTVKELLKNVSLNMKRLRKQRGMTQLQLSVKTKLTLSTVCGFEQGRFKNISLKTIVVISKALGVNPLKLLK